MLELMNAWRRLAMSEDIIVLGGLAGVLCWTYVVLPLMNHIC
jgi:hypothetical protein